MSRRAVVVGAGFVGARVCELFKAQGWNVTGVRKSNAAQAVINCDVIDVGQLRAHEECAGADFLVYCVSSGRGGADVYERVYLNGLRNVLEVWQPRQFLFTSSTSVYVQTDGSWVTEESPAEPERETSRILRAAEDCALAAGGVVARLAGIYGPGRSILIKRFLDRTAIIEGDGSRYINQIHRDDAAAAVQLLSSIESRGSIFNVCDDAPMTQLDCYRALAAFFDRSLPPSGPIQLDRKRAWTNKRVSNQKLRALGWCPAYPSFVDALKYDPALLKRADGTGDGLT